MVTTLQTTALSARLPSPWRSCRAAAASLDPPSRMVGIEHMARPYHKAMVGCIEYEDNCVTLRVALWIEVAPTDHNSTV